MSADSKQTNTEFRRQEMFDVNIERSADGGLDLSASLEAHPGAPHLHVHSNAARDLFTMQITVKRGSLVRELEKWELINFAAALNAYLARLSKDGRDGGNGVCG